MFKNTLIAIAIVSAFATAQANVSEDESGKIQTCRQLSLDLGLKALKTTRESGWGKGRDGCSAGSDFHDYYKLDSEPRAMTVKTGHGTEECLLIEGDYTYDCYTGN